MAGADDALPNGVGAANANAAGGNAKLSAAQKKKLQKKRRKEEKRAEREAFQAKQLEAEADRGAALGEDEGVEIEYVSAPEELLLPDLAAAAQPAGDQQQQQQGQQPMDEDGGDGGAAGLGLGFTPAAGSEAAAAANGGSTVLDDFRRVLQRFGTVEQLLGTAPPPGEEGGGAEGADGAARDAASEPQHGEGGGDEDEDEEGEGGDGEKLSRKKKKLASRLKIAELKQACERPDVVEVWDVTAADPKMLVFLKAYRNTVAIPRHWSQKRKYLQGKRGIEKPPFRLPEFIEATGIGEMRQTYLEKEGDKKMKQKARDRMQPKMGKLDIDYQVLHDAFFKYQTKPKLSGMGELYYEGKEYEAKLTSARPGVLSEELQGALGMSEGAPPPWLINMQRYGPPPSYPALRIPGLNAPIPPGAHFGYQPGGWGKPPVDEDGNPIYGDVFGQQQDEEDEYEQQVDRSSRWGDLDEEEEEESSEEEESEEEEVEGGEEDDTESLADGMASVASGFASSLPSGIETPSEIDLRKGKEGPRQLYTVLEQQKASVGANLMGSEYTYAMPGQDKKGLSIAAQKRLEALRKEMPSDVDISIDPTDLEGLDDAALRELYEMRVAEERSKAGREDFSDLVAAKAAAQKRKAAERKEGKDKKFKF